MKNSYFEKKTFYLKENFIFSNLIYYRNLNDTSKLALFAKHHLASNELYKFSGTAVFDYHIPTLLNT